jgi:ubiquinone/menaquinone biosynthesis C-methylase UbiE
MTMAKVSLDRGASGPALRVVPRTIPDTDPLVARTRAVWTAGDFERIAEGYRDGAEMFIGRLGLREGETVLDVACGTGNLTLPAARRGAHVTGLDIAPNLLDTAAERAASEGLAIRFDEGNAEELPYADGSFETVVTMYGAMFAPRPERAAAELLRVVRPGGRVAMANWTPGSFIGAMLRAHTRRTIRFDYPIPPAGVVQLFRDWYGPTIRTFEALDAGGQARLRDDLITLWSDHNSATDGTTQVESEYLEVVAER